MFNFTRHFQSSLQPLLERARTLTGSQRSAWLNELRAECPTVTCELERMLTADSRTADVAEVETECVAVAGSLESLGLRW